MDRRRGKGKRKKWNKRRVRGSRENRIGWEGGGGNLTGGGEGGSGGGSGGNGIRGGSGGDGIRGGAFQATNKSVRDKHCRKGITCTGLS